MTVSLEHASIRRTRIPGTLRKIVSGVSCGTLGELFQGPYWDAGCEPQIAIISLPVEKYTWCHFIPLPDGHPTAGDGLADRPKSALAVQLFLRQYGQVLPPGRWEFHSELPVGKGMASSTADLVAVVRCLFNIFAIGYDRRVVIDILRAIERSDTVFLDEFALYLSGRHEIVRSFGAQLGLYTCYVVEDAPVRTEEITGRLLAHYRRHAPAYRQCLDGVAAAFAAADARAVARCATVSAELSQGVLPKLSFDEVVGNRRGFRADGVFVAHTGSVIGYLFTEKLDHGRMDELSAFFRDIGRQCYFAKGGWGSA